MIFKKFKKKFEKIECESEKSSLNILELNPC